MIRDLPSPLFIQGQPLRASSWNQLIDASVEMVDVWSGEHLDGERHAPARLESAAILLEWTGSDWHPFQEDEVSLAYLIDYGDRFELGLEFWREKFWSRRDYAVIVQGDDGVPGITLEPSKSPQIFAVVVPRGGSPGLEKMSIVVYGRERGAE